MTPEEAMQYAAEGQFAPGSMLPKVEAAVKFPMPRSSSSSRKAFCRS